VIRPGFMGTSWSFAIRSVTGCSWDGKRVEQSCGPQRPTPPAARAPSLGPTDRASTRTPTRRVTSAATGRTSTLSSEPYVMMIRPPSNSGSPAYVLTGRRRSRARPLKMTTASSASARCRRRSCSSCGVAGRTTRRSGSVRSSGSTS
jgi:hypothetical protein